jgi:hypothetical protein
LLAGDGCDRDHDASSSEGGAGATSSTPAPSGAAAPAADSLLAPSAVARFDRDGATLRPRFDAAGSPEAAHPALVALPARAGGAFRVEDRGTGLAVEVALAGAADVPASILDDHVLYPRAHAGESDVIHRVTPVGTEDFISFAQAPLVEEVTYHLTLGDGVAGLRLVARTLELTGADGVPRLRMARPWIAGADGVRHDAEVSVRGCDVDHDPSPPWGRPPVPPGSGRCDVVVSWHGVAYPAILDPTWSTTGNMTMARSDHTASRLASGTVLVAGGINAFSLNEAEIYNPATKTWAATASMAAHRRWHGATVLPNGKVLVAGGYDNYVSAIVASAELYDPALGTWSAANPMSKPHQGPTFVTLLDGRRLAAIGANSSPCEIYDPATGAWSTTGAMTSVQSYLSTAAVVLADGRVLAAGGGYFGVAAAELYNPATGTWTATNPMSTARASLSLIRLSDGRVLAAGGWFYVAGSWTNLASAEIFDPATNTWSPTGAMAATRGDYTMTLLGNSKVLVAGGTNIAVGSGNPAATELYNPSSGAFEPAGVFASRYRHSATALATGEVLAAGGLDGPTNSAQLFALAPAGAPCTSAPACFSGYCVDGVCCSGPCSALCLACAGAKTGAADGTCAPVLAATDPDGDCTDTGSPSCAQNGLCDGAGACQKYPQSSGCTPNACAGNAACTSGHCVDGICCDTACTGPCVACTAAKKGGGADGVCGAVAIDTDPDGDCPTDVNYPASCGADGLCDGTGKCRVAAKSGTVCVAPSCAGATVTLSQCNGSGACVQGTTSCAPFLCANGSACATSCSSDAQCDPSAWCDPVDHLCHADQAVGSACTAASQCSSGTCADGVCCATPCTGVCQACSAAKKGSGLDGDCGPVKAGTDPDDDCAADAPGSCQKDGMCDGAGACRLYVSGVSCGASQCVGNKATGQICNGLGACGNDPAGADCAPYLCAAGACPSSCVSDLQCTPGSFCDTGLCAPKRASGAACTAASQCASAFCVDGVCCATACTQLCQACSAAAKQSGIDGECGPAKTGTDPHGDCPDDGKASCQRDGQCDQGACRLYAKGTLCGAAQCVGNEATPQSCDGLGSPCGLEPSGVDCGAYLCVAGTCPASCAADSQCANGHYCDQAQCKPKGMPGAACTASTQCASTFCVDGVCCDQACGAQCAACDVPGHEGTCSPSQGAPEGGRPACDGAGTPCAGSCDGMSKDKCAYPNELTPCGSTCADDKQTLSVCNAGGDCVAKAPEPCGAYTCDGTTQCRTACAADADCATGYRCSSDDKCVPTSSATCIDDVTLKAPDGKTSSCAPFLCSGSACRTTCASLADCAPGFACDETHQCVPPPMAHTQEGGCSCGVVGEPSPGTSRWGAALLLAACALRLDVRRGRRRARRS